MATTSSAVLLTPTANFSDGAVPPERSHDDNLPMSRDGDHCARAPRVEAVTFSNYRTEGIVDSAPPSGTHPATPAQLFAVDAIQEHSSVYVPSVGINRSLGPPTTPPRASATLFSSQSRPMTSIFAPSSYAFRGVSESPELPFSLNPLPTASSSTAPTTAPFPPPTSPPNAASELAFKSERATFHPPDTSNRTDDHPSEPSAISDREYCRAGEAGTVGQSAEMDALFAELDAAKRALAERVRPRAPPCSLHRYLFSPT